VVSHRLRLLDSEIIKDCVFVHLGLQTYQISNNKDNKFTYLFRETRCSYEQVCDINETRAHI
jgi:hypothetical protein